MKIRRRIKSGILLAIALIVAFSSLVFAATWEYKFPTQLQDTSDTTRAYYPALLGYTGQTFIDSGKIAANGLDTNMQVGSTSIPYMISTTNVLAAVPSIPSGGKQTVDFYRNI